MSDLPGGGIGHRRVYYGWLVLAATLTVGFVQVASRNPLLSVFIKPMTAEYGWSRAEVSLMAGVGFAIGGVVAMAVGPLMDRYGPRRFIVAGVAILGLSFMAISGVSAAWQFYVLLSLGRLADVGFMELGGSVAVANWFFRRRGRALGFYSVATRVGTAIWPLLAQVFIVAYGWRAGWLAVGAGVLVFALVPAALFLRRRPEDMGLTPDGLPGAPSASGAGAAKVETSFSLRQALRTPAMWLLMVANCFALMVAIAINLHMYPRLTDAGLSESVAIIVLTMVAVLSGAGALIWGFIVERLHVRWSMPLAMALCAVGLVLLVFARTPAMAYAYAVVYGLALGGFLSLTPTMWATYFGRESLGAIRGFTFPALQLLAALSPVFAGWVYDVSGSYTWAFIPFAGLYVVAAALVAMARVPERLARAAVSPT
ncbi:MAG: MFS transporter [Dehalococcoidia bacterium]|nr:MFS transporter [Dehalococcoidia bacterium]